MSIHQQVDYDSEEERDEDGDDGEEKEDQGEPAEENVDSSPEVSRPEFRKVKLQRTKNLSQLRVNSVLQSNSAIEGYSYDSKHELWCEVSLDTSRKLNQTILRDLFFSQDLKGQSGSFFKQRPLFSPLVLFSSLFKNE